LGILVDGHHLGARRVVEVYRFGWHIDLWDNGPNKNAVRHCACDRMAIWSAPSSQNQPETSAGFAATPPLQAAQKRVAQLELLKHAIYEEELCPLTARSEIPI
jgi:hypothetical protein